MIFTLISSITSYLFGRRYYAVVLEKKFPNQAGQFEQSLSGYIFDKKTDARTYFYQMKAARTATSVELVSFRSRHSYQPYNTNFNVTL